METFRSYIFYLILIGISGCSGSIFPVFRKKDVEALQQKITELEKTVEENSSKMAVLKEKNKNLETQLEEAGRVEAPESREARAKRLAKLKELNEMIDEIKRKNKTNIEKVDSLIEHYETEQRQKNS